MRIVIITSCVLLCSLVLSSCGEDPSLVPSPVLISSQTPPPIGTNVPSATTTITATTTPNNKTIILTPDDLFALPELKILSTPNSANFCEHIPSPEVTKSSNQSFIFAGRFSLCLSGWQFLVDTVMDLDQGKLVPTDDMNGDIEMAMFPHSNALYYVHGLNNVSIDEIQTSNVSYSYCESLLQALNDSDRGVLIVKEGAIACVMTTEEQIALVRVENYYPLETQSVGFSFAILRNE